MYKLPFAERGRNILHERHKRDVYDIHRKKVRTPTPAPPFSQLVLPRLLRAHPTAPAPRQPLLAPVLADVLLSLSLRFRSTA